MASVAVVQINSTSDVLYNLKKIESYFEYASAKGADLMVLPENFAFMGVNEHDKLKVAETFGHGLIQDTIAKLALVHKMWVIAGTIPLKTKGKHVRSSALVFDERGKVCGRYDKIHLFDVAVSEDEPYRESTTIERGNQIVCLETPVGCIGLSICYDLRFPELYRQLQMKGAEIFVIPSAFTAITGKAHWEALLRARAIENLCYVVAPNQYGVYENRREAYGHSMIVEPWGGIVGSKPDGSGVLIADIDLAYLHKLRTQFPCNSHHVL